MKNMDKNVKILLGMLVLTVVLFGLNLFLNREEKNEYAKEEYIEIKGESIPTIYKLIGEKKITDVKTGIDSTGNYVELTYQNLSFSELTDYLKEFKDKDYVLISSSEDSATIVGESTEEGKIITILFERLETDTKIKYSKGSGVLTRN